MKRLLVFVSALLVAFSFLPTTAVAQATSQTTVVHLPFDFSYFVPCANDGQGETVSGSGYGILITTTVINNKNTNIQMMFDPRGAKFTGETTGLTYHSVGVLRLSQSMVTSELPFEGAFISKNYFVSETSAVNYKENVLLHYTVNENGETTAFVEHSSITCK